jgi:hypothetical protein
MSADAEEAARAQARPLEAENPLWIVIFGVSSREFPCFSQASVSFRAFLVARVPPHCRPGCAGPTVPLMSTSAPRTAGCTALPLSHPLRSRRPTHE